MATVDFRDPFHGSLELNILEPTKYSKGESSIIHF